jgi:hypothetical protein
LLAANCTSRLERKDNEKVDVEDLHQYPDCIEHNDNLGGPYFFFGAKLWYLIDLGELAKRKTSF